jgi:hypothetical protein
MSTTSAPASAPEPSLVVSQYMLRKRKAPEPQTQKVVILIMGSDKPYRFQFTRVGNDKFISMTTPSGWNGKVRRSNNSFARFIYEFSRFDETFESDVYLMLFVDEIMERMFSSKNVLPKYHWHYTGCSISGPKQDKSITLETWNFNDRTDYKNLVDMLHEMYSDEFKPKTIFNRRRTARQMQVDGTLQSQQPINKESEVMPRVQVVPDSITEDNLTCTVTESDSEPKFWDPDTQKFYTHEEVCRNFDSLKQIALLYAD